MVLEILAGFDRIKPEELVSFDGEIMDGEDVVGNLSLHMKQLWTVLTQLVNSAEEKVKRVRADMYNMGENELEIALLEIEADTEKMEFLRDIFWREVRGEFNLDSKDLAIREGGVVVAIPENDPEISLADLLYGLGDLKSKPIDDCGDPNCPIHGASALEKPARRQGLN